MQSPNLQFVKIIVLNRSTPVADEWRQVLTCTRAKIYSCYDSRSLRTVTVEYLQQEERITRKMYSLHKYFKESSVVPSSTSTYSFLSKALKQDIESANDSVGTAFAKKPTTTSRVGLKYNTYTPKQRAEVGKYAAENGNTSAARHFSKVLQGVWINRKKTMCTRTRTCTLSMLLYSPNLYSPITFSDQCAKFNGRQNNHVYGNLRIFHIHTYLHISTIYIYLSLYVYLYLSVCQMWHS